MTTILVIEDELGIRENIQEILELEDFEVLTAPNGKIGVELALKHNPDLIICDVMMPELDGYGVLMALRQDPRTVGTPFIFLSAKAAKEDHRKGMELGADDYLTKPFTPKEICQAINTRLQKQAILLNKYSSYFKFNNNPATSSIATIEAPPVQVVKSVLSPVKVIKPVGVLDVTNCGQLRRQVTEIAETGAQKVLIDLQNVNFVDSSGLASLVFALQKVNDVGGKLSICSINAQVKMLFELSSMDSIFDIYDTAKDFDPNLN
jgi:anti-anti-sigma factor